MKARLTALFATLLLAFSGNLFAVGLGDIKVESGLNEPFRARIALLKVGDLSDAEILVKIGSEQQFAERKMSRDYLYTRLRFQVDLQDKKNPSVLVTTEEAVKEPSLDFLVQLEWPNGRLVRGYTVLLEKP
jgi:pilus assembly protein FimV